MLNFLRMSEKPDPYPNNGDNHRANVLEPSGTLILRIEVKITN